MPNYLQEIYERSPKLYLYRNFGWIYRKLNDVFIFGNLLRKYKLFVIQQLLGTFNCNSFFSVAELGEESIRNRHILELQVMNKDVIQASEKRGATQQHHHPHTNDHELG